MRSRACAANHYVIAEKFPYVQSGPVFVERRFSEQVPNIVPNHAFVKLSENCRINKKFIIELKITGTLPADFGKPYLWFSISNLHQKNTILTGIKISFYLGYDL